MRKISLVLAALLLLAFSAGASAEPAKVGYVDLQRAMNQSEHGRNVKIELEAIVKEKSDEVEKLALRREALQKDLENNRMVMSEEAVRDKIDEIKKIERNAERIIGESNEDLSRLQREKELGILKDLDDIINAIGREGGYTLILPAEMVLFAPDGSSITDEVIKRYNEKKGLTPAKE
ncbi:MAG: OmpH family outer membrane protein [Thermodesulfovibrionales bacterium]|nr:OmpH family outer membrane protein [Thermodesulfovibrionales bacterium]